MKTTGSKAAAAARIGAALGRRKGAELLGLLRPCFVRTEVTGMDAVVGVAMLVIAMAEFNKAG